MKLLLLLFSQACFCEVGKPILPDIRTAVFGTKYFHETDQCFHCDARYFKKITKDKEPIQHVELAGAYLTTMKKLGFETWIAHGSLLGWWWQGSSMGFDTDTDVQVLLETMDGMAANYNFTTHTVSSRVTGEPRDYLLDVNPNYRDRMLGAGDLMLPNIIDARFIDMENGLFVDITALSPKNADSDIIQCKTPHRYHKSQIFPLIPTMFDGVSAFVPQDYRTIVRTSLPLLI